MFDPANNNEESFQLFAHGHPVSPQDHIRLRCLVLAPLVEFHEWVVELGVPGSLNVHVSSVDHLTIGQGHIALRIAWTSGLTFTGDEAFPTVPVDRRRGQLLGLASGHRPIEVDD